MAGPGKGKNKKNKGKSDNVHSLCDKQHETSSSKVILSKNLSVRMSKLEEIGKKCSPATSEYNNRMVEELLMEKVELIYKIALERLMNLGFGMDVVTRAILMSGSIFGGTNILSNILSNTLPTITKRQATDETIDIQPIFQDIRELARFSMQTLINMIVKEQSNTTKTDAILYLLQNDCLAVPSHSKGQKDQGYYEKASTSDIDIGRMLKENTTCLQKLNIRIGTSSSSLSTRRHVAKFVSEPQITYPYFVRSRSSSSSSDAFEADSVEFLKSLTDCPDGMSLEAWFRTCEEHIEGGICSILSEKIKDLEIQLKERKEWAKKTVIEAAKKFNATSMELKDLRLGRNEIYGLHKQKEEVDSFNSSKITERENHLRNLNHDLDIVNQVKGILEAKNREYKSEIAAYNLSISESEKSDLEAQKNERKTLKKSKDTEKHIEDLKRSIGEEKQKIAEMTNRMEQVNEEIEQAKLRLRPEKEAKEQAHALLLEEKRLNRLEKENPKNRLASVKRELDTKYRQLVDKEKKLELELSKLKAQDSSNGSSSSSSSFSSAQIDALDNQNRASADRSSRPCIICRKGEVSVLFLPCAHQVICSDCNEEVFDALEDHCPCCKTLIQKRVRVFCPSR